jgi:hypothetical protein
MLKVQMAFEQESKVACSEVVSQKVVTGVKKVDEPC